jgi:hypothetical protein
MPPVRRVLLWAIALSCVALMCGWATAAGKKPGKVHCRHGTLPVKILGKTRCRAAGRALPRPQKGDPRLAFFQSALG